MVTDAYTKLYTSLDSAITNVTVIVLAELKLTLQPVTYAYFLERINNTTIYCD